MKTPILKLVAALVTGSALLVALPAEAGRDDHRDRHEYRGGHDRHDRHDWRDERRGRSHFRDDRRHHDRVVIKERVIVDRRPVARGYGYGYYDRPVRYYAPAPVYSRDPAIVIGVNIPPIIIPFR